MPDIKKAQLLLKKYKNARSSLTSRIVQNEQWYKLRHVSGVAAGGYVPASAWLFNSLAVKHADAMESIPTPYVSAREPSDAESAEALSKLLPVILEQNERFLRCFKADFVILHTIYLLVGTCHILL